VTLPGCSKVHSSRSQGISSHAARETVVDITL
jgi:hypothetical protein